MPAPETKLVVPRLEERDGPVIDAPDGYYFIHKKDGSVWIEPKDGLGGPHLADPENYPGEIIERLEERLWQQTEPKFIDLLRKRTEGHMIYYNLAKEKTAWGFYDNVLKRLLQEAAERKGGVNSLTIHFALSNGGVCTLPSDMANNLKLLLKEEGFRLSVGNFISSGGPGSASVHIQWTISW